MDNITFSDGSRIIYLAAGHYLVSRGARISRVQTPDREGVTPSVTTVGTDDGTGSDVTERGGQPGDTTPQAGSAPEGSLEDEGSLLGDTLEPEPPYDNDSVMTDDGQPDNRPSVGGLTVTSQGPSHPIRVPHHGNYVAQNLMSKDVFARMAATMYDPLWIQTYNVDPAVMDGFTSRIKLEEMFGRGVFELGDCFHLVTAEGVAHTAAEAFVHSFPAARNAFPDFRVHTVATRRDHFLWACNGIGPLYAAMGSPDQFRRPNYHSFQVTRNGRVLGNLGDLRQALHVYLAEKQNWDRQG